MASWWGSCWDSVSVQLPHGLQEQLSSLGHTIMESLGGSGGGGGAAAGQEYALCGRRLRVIKQLGEGGYSFVYLVRELPPSTAAAAAAGAAAGATPGSSSGGALAPLAPPSTAGVTTGSGQRLFALKRVLCGGPDQLAEARREIDVMRRLNSGGGACLLRLLDAEVAEQRLPDGSSRHVALLLFPVYEGGNLFDFVQQQQQQLKQGSAAAGGGAAGGTAATAAQRRREAARHELRLLLGIFLQVCAALHGMHAQQPALAHRDVKPHNVLLRRRQQDAAAGGGGGGGSGVPAGKADGVTSSYDPVPPIAPPTSSSSPKDGGWTADGWASFGGGDQGSSSSAAAAAVFAVEEEGRPQPDGMAAAAAAGHRHQHLHWAASGEGCLGEEWWAARLPRWQAEWEAVLMDFGSARPALVQVRNRAEAMAVQEDAERLCSAPYRAPELWDVPSSCTINERVDVWSLGCLLYFLVCGTSPFERAAGEAGGSLMLAAVNGRLSWPEDAAARCPEGIKQLVARCLDTDPSSRPRVAEVAAAADRLHAALML